MCVCACVYVGGGGGGGGAEYCPPLEIINSMALPLFPFLASYHMANNFGQYQIW